MAGSMRSGKGNGSRLKPIRDQLDGVGFVSKGDKALLNLKAQENYYDKIVERYLGFCARYSKDLDAAWSSLPVTRSGDAAANPPAPATSAQQGPSASDELSKLLLSLRKLREAVLSTASTTSISFSQRVHVFSIRLSILAQHPPSYFPSIRYLLENLHRSSHPVPESELKEFISYMILDYACRQDNMVAAFDFRARARAQWGFKSQTVDRALAALIHDNWVVFWKVRNGVDSYMRALMNMAADRVRKHALKAIGSAYLNADVKWILDGCTGENGAWTWEKLVDTERLGWAREGDLVVIKRPRRRPEKK